MATLTPYVLQSEFTTSLRNLFDIQQVYNHQDPHTEVWVIKTPFNYCGPLINLFYYPELEVLRDGGFLFENFMPCYTADKCNKVFKEFINKGRSSGLLAFDSIYYESFSFVSFGNTVELCRSNVYHSSLYSLPSSSLPFDIFGFYEILVALYSFISLKANS